MIESRYWRNALRTDIAWLRTKQRYKRWSERQVVLYERKLMLVAFQVRTLLDRPKVNGRVRTMTLGALSYPKIGQKPFTVVGGGWLHEHFDVSSPTTVQLSVKDVCNQFIHYYWMSTASERQRFTSILVFSDFRRKHLRVRVRHNPVDRFLYSVR